MPVISPAQVYQYAVQAGFTGQAAINATAIALAESGGNTDVTNSIGATGLWQIYDGPGMSASREAQLRDPVQNAKEAFAKYQASLNTQCGGWWPWAAYNEGPCQTSDPNRNNTWRNFLGVASAASAGINADIPTPNPAAGGNTSGTPSGTGSGDSTSAGSPFASSVFGSGIVIIGAILTFFVGVLAWRGREVIQGAAKEGLPIPKGSSSGGSNSSPGGGHLLRESGGRLHRIS